MSDIQNEELGRRRFQIRKEKAVEDACERIRRANAEEWEALSHKDRDVLREVLGETWSRTDNTEWGSFAFSAIPWQKVRSLITIGNQIKTGTKNPDVAFKDLNDILNMNR